MECQRETGEENMYKYILWDLDNTIMDFEYSQNCAIRALFKKYNLGECSDEMLKVYTDINHKYWAALERGEVEKNKMLVDRFSDFFNIYGLDTSCCKDFNDDYQVTLGDYVQFMPGAKEVLFALKDKYVHLLVTNGTKVAQMNKIKTSGIGDFFDRLYISEDVGYEKPAKEFFDYMFENEKITDKSEFIIIGDSLSSDILGGNNAGIDTCWFNPGKKVNNSKVTVTFEISELKELLNYL